MSSRVVLTAGSLMLAGVLVSVVPVAAQGNGHGNAFGRYKSTVTAATPSSPSGPDAVVIPGTGVRNFGSWLDDASVMEVGSGYVSVGFGLFKTPVYREIDVPTIDGGVAVHKRVQLGMSVPYFHVGLPGEPGVRGFGDVYLNAKVQLRAPTPSRPGVSVIPMVEVLSVSPPDGSSRVQWALPASVEWQRRGWRLMTTGGYFSRGAMFGSGALEFQLSERLYATGVVSHSYSTRRDDLSAALGLQRSRTDANGGLAVSVRPNVMVYGSLGRTISKRDANSASLMLAAGVTLAFQ